MFEFLKSPELKFLEAIRKKDEQKAIKIVESGKLDLNNDKMSLNALIGKPLLEEVVKPKYKLTKENLNMMLRQAVEERNIKDIKILVKNGADINHKNEKGDTLLIRSSFLSTFPLRDNELHVATAKALMKMGADITAENKQGQTALSFLKTDAPLAKLIRSRMKKEEFWTITGKDQVCFHGSYPKECSEVMKVFNLKSNTRRVKVSGFAANNFISLPVEQFKDLREKDIKEAKRAFKMLNLIKAEVIL